MQRVKPISFVTVAVAFLLAVGVGGVEGTLKDSMLVVDTVVNKEYDEGENTVPVTMAMAGDTVKVELFVKGGGGKEAQGFQATFVAVLGETMIDEGVGWTIADQTSIFGLSIPQPGMVNWAQAGSAVALPDNGYIGAVHIVVAAPAPVGVAFKVKSAVIALAGGTDSLDVSAAIVTVVQPPPVLIGSGDMLMDGNVDIPYGESASVNVSLEGVVSDSPSVSWSVETDTVGTGTLTILDADGNEVMLDSMMMASGPTSLKLQVTGGSLTVTVKANVDGRNTEPESLTFTFTQLGPPPSIVGMVGDMMGNMVDIPAGESASIDVSLKDVASDSPSVSWSVTTDTVGTGTLTILDADGNEVMLDSMMMASGPTSLTLQVTGGSLMVTVKANVDGEYTEAATFTFNQLEPAGPAIVVDPKMDGNMFQIPADGNVQVTLSLENLPDTASISWAITGREGDGSFVVLDTDGNMLEPDDMMMVSADSIVLKVSGGTLQLTGKAIVNGEDTPPITLTFSQLNPAELASFDGAMQEDRVVLNWSTVSQTNNAGWQITRSVDGETFEAVGEFVQGAGTSDALMNYTFEDKNLPGVEKVYYRLEQVDLDGSVSQSNVIEVLLGARMPLPTEFAINVYPNPFNPSTTISYELPEGAPVSVVIYDVLGQQVRRLISQFNAAGRYSIQWDARDNQGRGVASGVYIAKVDAGTATLSQKMLLLK